MNELQIFNNEEFGSIRTVIIDGKPYVVGLDVARALGYSNTSKAVSTHCKHARKVVLDVTSQNGNSHIRGAQASNTQEMYVIPEGDIYRLITKSKLPAAEKFEAWVMDEVLPTIRDHGVYMTPEAIERTLSDPDFIIQMATTLKEERLARQAAELKLQKQQPLVDFANHVSNSDDLIDISEMAKLLSDKGINIGRNRLFQMLRDNGILMSGAHQNEPYQEYIDRGYFKTKEILVVMGTDVCPMIKTYVTGKGQKFIYSFVSKRAAS